MTNGGGRGKDKTIAGILGIILGGFGVHNFYLGATTAGIINIAATFVTCGAGSLLGFVEGILLLVMKDEEFKAKYNDRAPEAMEFVFMKAKPPAAGAPPAQ